MIVAKMKVESLELTETSETVKMRPVSGDSPENKQWSKYTPSGELRLQIDNPQAQNQLTAGDIVYVGIERQDEALAKASPAPQAPPPVVEPDALAKRLATFEANLNRIETARMKLQSFYGNGRLTFPQPGDAPQYLEYLSGIGSDVLDLRGDLKVIRELLGFPPGA